VEAGGPATDPGHLYPAEMAAARQVAAQGNVKHYFVEHEGQMAHPPLESIANLLEYLKTL
jgi:hypothetical protein